MADFKTALNALSRGEIEYDAISRNLTKLLKKQPAVAVNIMQQLREAYGEDLIDATIYARLKKVVAENSAPDDRRASGGGDATQFDAGGSTAFTSADPTQFTDDDFDTDSIAAQARAAITAATESSAIDFDLTGDSLPSDGSWPTDGADTGATGTGWAETTAEPEPEAKIEPGSVLKDRFQLDDVLGIGGMGTVYRGRDLIKVEARDKNPYVALKVLNEDFKQHPDSFIALQREASRQQKLAHPNIATVYDFDRHARRHRFSDDGAAAGRTAQYVHQEERPAEGRAAVRGSLPDDRRSRERAHLRPRARHRAFPTSSRVTVSRRRTAR